MTTWDFYMQEVLRRREMRREARKRVPDTYVGDLSDAEAMQRIVREIFESEHTDWDQIKQDG